MTRFRGFNQDIEFVGYPSGSELTYTCACYFSEQLCGEFLHNADCIIILLDYVA